MLLESGIEGESKRMQSLSEYDRISQLSPIKPN